MKKLILGLVAIATAFTLQALNESVNTGIPDADTEKQTPELYWYRVNNSGVIQDAAATMFSGLKQTKAYALTHSPCDIGTAKDCLRGFVTPIPTTSFPTDDQGTDQVKRP